MKIKLLPALLLSATTLIAAPAFAQDIDDSECSMDADCPTDFTCEEVAAYESCVDVAPCPEDDANCVEPPPCESGVIMGCVAPPPEQCDPAMGAAACETGLTCVSYTYEQCSGGTPITCTTDPDGVEDCPEPGVPESCTTEVESYCVPPFFAECAVDTDCGPGFRCADEPVQCYTACTNGAPERDGDPVSNCTETCDDPSGDKICELIETECTSDADCSSGLTCVTEDEFYGGSSSGGSAPDCPPADPDDPSAGDDDECGATVDPDVPDNDEAYCLPVGWERWIDGPPSDGGSYDDTVSNASGREEGDWELVEKSSAPVEPQQPDYPSLDNDVRDDDGGCQTTGKSDLPGGLGLLAALGMMLGLRRRKR